MSLVFAKSSSEKLSTISLVSGGFVLIGFLTRPATIFQIIILVGAMVMFCFDFITGPPKIPKILAKNRPYSWLYTLLKLIKRIYPNQK